MSPHFLLPCPLGSAQKFKFVAGLNRLGQVFSYLLEGMEGFERNRTVLLFYFKILKNIYAMKKICHHRGLKPGPMTQLIETIASDYLSLIFQLTQPERSNLIECKCCLQPL